MRPEARLLLIEADALGVVLAATPAEAFDNQTVCTDWSVRDVLAHCAAALTAIATGEFHRFTPEDNQREVDERRGWPLSDVLAELQDGYRIGAEGVDKAGGALDGIAIGEWMHGGDVRDAVGAPNAYASEGVQIALDMLVARSVSIGKVRVDVDLGDTSRDFGSQAGEAASLVTDIETFVRLCGGRRPDPVRYELVGAEPSDLVIFS